jgi:heme O synthase-like polyprenyltransferase
MSDGHSEVSRSEDFQTHEATYKSFLAVTKLGIIHLALLMIGLYCVIVANQGLLGGLFILLAVIVPVGLGIFRRV